MFSLKKSRNNEFNGGVQEEFVHTLSKISGILEAESLPSQVEVVRHLVELLNQQKNDQFIESLNGIEMWGGSGAVWEVHIEDYENAKKFENEIVKLIDLMEKTNVLGKRIKPIRKIFMENIRGENS